MLLVRFGCGRCARIGWRRALARHLGSSAEMSFDTEAARLQPVDTSGRQDFSFVNKLDRKGAIRSRALLLY
jgi:hypothetical protein